MTKKRYFGTDGIRGRVGEGPISADFVLKLGWALGQVLAGGTSRRPSVVIGKDTRISGYMFESALEAGLVASGTDVMLLGPMPTPAVAWLARTLRADAGVVISASHNPHYDNGIKFFSGRGEKLDDATELAIEAALDQAFLTQPSESLGKATRVRDAAARYIEFCKSTVPPELSLKGLRIALDCAHGANYQVGPAVFSELGAQVIGIGTAPDGVNINNGVGSTHMQTVTAAVREHGCDVGIAFDGDGDRVQMVAADGRLCDGDDLLYILATDWHSNGRLRGPVVGTAMSNYGLEQALQAREIGFMRARVGDRYVHQSLIEHAGVLGGETSGHILCLDRASTGDAIVSALQVLAVLMRNQTSLAEACAGFNKLPQVTRNVRCDAQAATADSVQAELAAVQAILAGRGRAFLRPSGTEPVVRVTVESADPVLVQTLVDRLAAAVDAAHAATSS
ncbi:MAG: phosphoglucosamine mutase [Gammaproteobacteria bacterium HGW-Gammaproteobacteria-2]|jgi:phosphoglucosamine mutase|nr:MAG: phosphoglucosamine mutase [Gammaproteobacteria bacterium HGW-Gammaproteobacteria-2]